VDYKHEYYSSSASAYVSKCNEAIQKRVIEYTGVSARINDENYSARKPVYGNSDADPVELMDEIVQKIFNDDSSTYRIRLRKTELICLGSSI